MPRFSMILLGFSQEEVRERGKHWGHLVHVLKSKLCTLLDLCVKKNSHTRLKTIRQIRAAEYVIKDGSLSVNENEI